MRAVILTMFVFAKLRRAEVFRPTKPLFCEIAQCCWRRLYTSSIRHLGKVFCLYLAFRSVLAHRTVALFLFILLPTNSRNAVSVEGARFTWCRNLQTRCNRLVELFLRQQRYIYGQGRSQKFAKGGGQKRGSGDGSPQRGSGAERRWGSGGQVTRSRRHTQISSYDGGTCTHVLRGYATVYGSNFCANFTAPIAYTLVLYNVSYIGK